MNIGHKIENKNKVIMVEVGDGNQTSIQENYDEDDSEDEQSLIYKESNTAKGFRIIIFSTRTRIEQNRSFESEASAKDQRFDNIEPDDDIEDPSEIIDTNTMVHCLSFIHNNNSNDNDGNIVKLEFPMPYKELQKYMAALFKRMGGVGEVWFGVNINKKTLRVVSFSLRRIE